MSFAQRTEGSSIIAGSKAAKDLYEKGRVVYPYIKDREMKVPFYSNTYLKAAVKTLEHIRGLS